MVFTPSENYWQAGAILALVTLGASAIARWWPAYQRELHVEEATRMLPLDGLRGILCLGVLLHHAAYTLQQLRTGDGWVPPTSHVYNLLGRTSVSLFFCITGFLFWGRVLRLGTNLNWFDFARSRVLRIVPMYAASALAVLAILMPSLARLHASVAQTARVLIEIASAGLLKWSPVVTSSGVAHPSSINAGVHWSLRYEWGFYAILPLLAVLASGRRTMIIWIGSLIALAVGTYLDRLTFITMFPVGMIAAHVARLFPLSAELKRVRYACVVVLALLLMVVLGQRPSGPFAWSLDPLSPLNHLLVFVIFVPIACGNSIFGVLRWRSLRLMGTISYGVYLIHGIVLYCARPVLLAHVQNADAPNLAYWSLVAVVALFTLATASVTYLAIERPFIRLERRLRKREAVQV